MNPKESAYPLGHPCFGLDLAQYEPKEETSEDVSPKKPYSPPRIRPLDAVAVNVHVGGCPECKQREGYLCPDGERLLQAAAQPRP